MNTCWHSISSAARDHGARANGRELGLLQAAAQVGDGDWHAACPSLDAVLGDYPRDALALQVAHLMDFYRGDALNLRNRVARVLPHWSREVPGYSYVLGMHAFGLKEMNQYPEAEDTAMRALAIERRDGWAVHAATQVMEMQGRIGEGIALLESREGDWASDNGFAYHNYWHLALFYMDGAGFDRALALFDQRIHPGPASYLLALVDATALLWRLDLENVDVGTRFEGVADEWEAALDRERGFYAFNDFHAAMAFVATGRRESLARVAAHLREAASGRGHGTTCLMAALLVHRGEIEGRCVDRHTHKEFLDFLKFLYRKYPGKQLHVIIDNYSAHKHSKVMEWASKRRRLTLHFTPTYASWLNQIEIWFGIFTRNVIRGGIWQSKQELVSQIMHYIRRYNQDNAQPFNWTYTGKPLVA